MQAIIYDKCLACAKCRIGTSRANERHFCDSAMYVLVTPHVKCIRSCLIAHVDQVQLDKVDEVAI